MEKRAGKMRLRVHRVYPDRHRFGEDLAVKKLMAYKYRLRPTAEQRVLLGKIAGTVTVKF